MTLLMPGAGRDIGLTVGLVGDNGRNHSIRGMYSSQKCYPTKRIKLVVRGVLDNSQIRNRWSRTDRALPRDERGRRLHRCD